MFLLHALFVGLAILLPTTVAAKETTIWSFEGEVIPGRWEVVRLTSTVRSPEGLRIETAREGHLTRPSELAHGIDAVSVTFRDVSRPTEAIFLWHIQGTQEGHLVQLPFLIEPQRDPQTIHLNVGYYSQWDEGADRIGLAFSSGAHVTLQRVELSRWNIPEKILEAWKSFWMFDEFRPYTINFVWGPLLATNPIARQYLFAKLPPQGMSVNWVFYAVLTLTGGALVLLWFLRGQGAVLRKRYVAVFLSVFASLWLTYDLRMGLEFLGYFANDYRTYISQQPGSQRAFRERGTFYDFVDAALPHVTDRERYIFMTTHRWPFLGAIRYLTYPALPTDQTKVLEGIDTWVIFDRPDIALNEKQQLVMDGVILSPPGRKVLDFAPDSFLFRSD